MTTAAPPDPALRETLDAGLRQFGLDTTLSAPLLQYLALLDRWNRTYNLTAIRDPAQMIGKHLLDSLAMHPCVADLAADGGTLADLGTGPGLPGIPLALAYPGLRVSLVESNGKKSRFLREAVRTLSLANATVVESRIEAFDAPGQFDAITARALATLPLILQLGGHLLKPDGRLLAMKGVRPDDEIAALPEGWRLDSAQALRVPGLEAERHLVTVVRG